MLTLLVETRQRRVFHLKASGPAVFYLADAEAGGVLINTPAFDPSLAEALTRIAPVRYAFYPSHLGAHDVGRWRAAGARTLASREEAGAIGLIDIPLAREHRFSRTMSFLPMSGRTSGSCALLCRNKPGLLFLGPILSRGARGWPTLLPQADDVSWENRVLGAVGLRGVRFEYVFTDDFEPRASRIGPGADKEIQWELQNILGF